MSTMEGNLHDPAALERLYRADEEAFCREFPEVFSRHSDSVVLQVWHQRLFYQGAESALPPVRVPSVRVELGLVIVLALVAGTVAKIPEYFGGPNAEVFYPRNISFVVWPALSVYLLWKNRQPRHWWLTVGLLFVAAAIFINLLPERKGLASSRYNCSDTLLLSCIHLPLVLWCVTGLAFAGGVSSRRWQFVKFSGEWLVYTGLLLIGGIVLTFLTLGLFSVIGVNIEQWYLQYVVVYGAAATAIVGAYAANAQMRVRIAPLVAKIFSPLVLLTLVGYLSVMAIQRKSLFTDRDFLLVFNGMLLLVVAIVVFAISARDSTAKLIVGDYIHISLIIVALVLDAIALSAILSRLFEYGFSPNRWAVLGANLVVCGNLIGLLWHYLQFALGKASLEKAQWFTVGYLAVQALWATFVTVAFPFIFRFR